LNELLQEALSLIESNVECWNDAAQHCEKLAGTSDFRNKLQWGLIVAVYRERAGLNADLFRRFSSGR
jgi:hypothetical protein